MKRIVLVGVLVILSACSTVNKSADVQVESLPPAPVVKESAPDSGPDYIVKERKPDPAPLWTEDFSKWKRESDGKGQTYFLGESGDVNDRISGCDMAALTAKKKIAQQLAELISNKIAANKQGRLAIDPSESNDPGLQRAFEEQVAGKSIAFLSGVKEYSTSWELRDYSKSGGHKRVYNCATVVVISDKDMQVALKRASQKTADIVEDPDAKSAVKDALKDIDRDFASYQPKSN